MPATKRAASAGAAVAGKKRKLNAVAKVLRRSKHFSQPVQRILGKAAADSLGVYKEDRHALQTTIVGMIGEVVTNAENDLKKVITDATGKVDELKANLASASAELQKAEADRSAKDQAEEAAKEAFSESDSNLSHLEKMKVKKAPWEEAPGKLESGNAGAMAAGTIRELVKCGKEIELQEIILENVTAGFKKAVEERSTFEKYAIKEFGEAVMDKVAELRKIDTSEETISLAASNKEGLKEALDAVKAAAKTAKDTEAAARKPEQALKSHVKRAEDALVVVNKKLQDFEKKPLLAFKDLVDLQAPPPPLEPAAEAEPAAPAAAE